MATKRMAPREIFLTLPLLEVTANNLCKQFGHRSVLTEYGSLSVLSFSLGSRMGGKAKFIVILKHKRSRK